MTGDGGWKRWRKRGKGPSEQGPPDTPPAARLQAHEGARWMLDAGWWNQERTKSQTQGKEEEKKPKPKRGRPGRNKRNQTGSGGPLIFWCSFGGGAADALELQVKK